MYFRIFFPYNMPYDNLSPTPLDKYFLFRDWENAVGKGSCKPARL